MSQYIFEETFNLRFAIPFEQHNTTISATAVQNLRPDQKRRIEKLNSLDIELYAFAKTLLFQRWVPRSAITISSCSRPMYWYL